MPIISCTVCITLLFVALLPKGYTQRDVMFQEEHLLIFYLVNQLEIYMNASISPADALIEGFVCSHALR